MKDDVKLSSFFESKVKKVVESDTSRTRNKVHVHGNWPTLIFIPSKHLAIEEYFQLFIVSLKVEGREEVDRTVKEITKDREFSSVDPITAEFPFHLSLSRTFYLKHHQKDLFCSKLTERLKALLSSFPVGAIEFKSERLAVYTNDERSTTFIAVDIENDSTVIKYIEEIDSILKEFGLPVYYQSPKLHFSLVWCKGDLKDLIASGEAVKVSVEIEHGNGIFVKCGNKISIIR